MKIYRYDADGWPVGEGDADESPLEPGVFLIPAGATQHAPPAPRKGKRVRFDGAGWAVEAIPAPPAPPAKTAEELRAEEVSAAQFSIAALEAKQARPVREALLGVAGAVERLAKIDAEIAALRARLAE